jgi:patatin-related protein
MKHPGDEMIDKQTSAELLCDRFHGLILAWSPRSQHSFFQIFSVHTVAEVVMTISSPQAEYTNEVRFAIVMYGGVSLAIYINGITQELLRLVRSTAEAANDENGARICLTGAQTGLPETQRKQVELNGTERVYRLVSLLTADKRLLAEVCQLAKDTKGVAPPNKLTEKLDALLADNNRPINLRFVVDILSGTSAGGINAIYLAKALANNQGIDQLKKLWIDEGDINVLINDKRSVSGLQLQNQVPPQSLLNSRRMYLKLLKSFNDMEALNPSQDKFNSPYVDEIDLFITTTDLAGMPLPIRLSDTVVYERRHRNVFHFKYASPESGEDRNDFVGENNPFLAFAARCTSSFPFAFEPMRLSDIDEVLDGFKDYRGINKEELKAKWQRFFKEKIADESSKGVQFSERAFGDGGYLDNKPFTYATETLGRRYAALPVDRKLIYIEPSPEHPEEDALNQPRPDALKNVKAALLDLPSYETIREDLQRLIQRNVLINRINRITTAVDKDHDHASASEKRPELKAGEWETLDLAGMVNKFGVYYLPYRRLRIAAVTDALAKLIARILRMEEESAEFVAVRVLIRAWREEKYPDYHRTNSIPAPEGTELTAEEKEEGKYTANQLLVHYDFAYWLRRLNFIRRKVDVLYSLKDLPAADENGNGVNLSELSEDEKATLNRFSLLRYNKFDYARLSAAQKESIHELLNFLRCQLKVIYSDLRAAGRKIQKPYRADKDNDQTLAGKIKNIPLRSEEIRSLLGLPEKPSETEPDYSRLDEDKCFERAQELFRDEKFANSFQTAARALKAEMKSTVVDPTWTRSFTLLKATEPLPEGCGACVRPTPAEGMEPIWRGVREYLWRYFSQFDDFDQISFPIMYGVEEGESDVVEIIRISPDDATTLINERKEKRDSPEGTGRRKLAGSALHHFGAFLDRTWRQNDIMWGRLDGAERLVTALLPDPDHKELRTELIRQAHTSILIDEMPPANRRELGNLMSDALVRASAGEPIESAVQKVLANLDAGSSVRTRLHNVMSNTLADAELLKFIATGYEVNRKLDSKMMLRAISRSTQVIGHVFEDVANQNSLDGKSLAWIARAGQVFWGLIEVAVPGSILNLLALHWLRLLYVFELILIIVSFLFSSADFLTFGLKLFAVTVVINMTVLLLRDKMRRKRGWLFGLIVFGVLIVFALAGIGISDLLGHNTSTEIVNWVTKVVGWLQALKAKIF